MHNTAETNERPAPAPRRSPICLFPPRLSSRWSDSHDKNGVPRERCGCSFRPGDHLEPRGIGIGPDKKHRPGQPVKCRRTEAVCMIQAYYPRYQVWMKLDCHLQPWVKELTAVKNCEAPAFLFRHSSDIHPRCYTLQLLLVDAYFSSS